MKFFLISSRDHYFYYYAKNEILAFNVHEAVFPEYAKAYRVNEIEDLNKEEFYSHIHNKMMSMNQAFEYAKTIDNVKKAIRENMPFCIVSTVKPN